MVEYVDECVGCTNGCIGSACRYRNVPHWYCDECGEEKELYEFDDEELCIDCIKSRLPKIRYSKRVA